MKSILAVLTVLVTLATTAHADILIIQNQGVTPVPVEEKRISMDYESVDIEATQGYQVEAVFHMRSHADAAITAQMAFPLMAPTYGHAMQESFKVESKAQGEPDSAYTALATALAMKKEKLSWAEQTYTKGKIAAMDYPGYVTWKASWEPKETRIFRVRYDMGVPESFRGIVDGWRLTYVVRTGALWKGPIGKADIRIRFGSNVRSHRTSTTPLTFSYPEHAKWVSNSEVHWHFENWEPTKDIQVAAWAWVGLTNQNIEQFSMLLPNPYKGAQKQYTRKWLDELVENELKEFKPVFPKRTAKLSRPKLRRLVALWLYHEIFARHGDPFVYGKDDGNGHWPPGVSMSMGGYLYSNWRTKFMGYMYHGGWYRPKDGPAGKVHLKDLSPTERKNVKFLKKFL